MSASQHTREWRVPHVAHGCLQSSPNVGYVSPYRNRNTGSNLVFGWVTGISNKYGNVTEATVEWVSNDQGRDRGSVVVDRVWGSLGPITVI